MSPFADADGYYTFELDGHRYEGDLLSAEHGFNLCIKLSGAVVDPLVTVVAPPLLSALAKPELVRQFQAAANSGDPDFLGAMLSADESALASALAAIDPRQVAGSLQTVIAALDLETVQAILAQTQRDGHRLDNMPAFNRAYRGNYMEAIKAAFKVARGNGLLPGLDTIASGLVRQSQVLQSEPNAGQPTGYGNRRATA